MGLKNFLDSALGNFEKDHGTPTFTLDGLDYRCVPSTERTTMPLEVEGFMLEVDLTLIVRKSMLSNKPATGKTLTFKGKTYRIERVSEPASGSHWEIAIKDPDQG